MEGTEYTRNVAVGRASSGVMLRKPGEFCNANSLGTNIVGDWPITAAGKRRNRSAERKAGTVSFPTSCTPMRRPSSTAASRCYIELVSHRPAETKQSRRRPGCAMAYRGVAMDLLGNSLATTPTPADAQAAWEALEKARAAGPKTQRERDWIEALSSYFRDYDKVPVNARLVAYNAAMERMAQSYPDDYEVLAYYALTLQASAPKSDLSYANQLKSAAILEKLFEQNPQHPGVTHYLIHAYDFAPLAERGVASARRYAGIAPAVPHARHMPSHIYSMVGLWEDSITSNASALEIEPTIITRQTSPFMRFCSSHRTRKQMR